MGDETPPQSEIILYQTEDGTTRIQCRLENNTIWLTQALIAELFQTTPQNVTIHLKAIYEEAELEENATCKDYLQVRAVFQTIQNKLHFAATGKTAPELITARADAARPNMGLTSWKGSIVRKGDVAIAKNYLTEEEVAELNRIVVMFLDFAEDQARRRKQLFLDDWKTKLDEFLRFNDRNVLPDAGKITRESAHEKAGQEYAQFNNRRRQEIEARAEQEAINLLEDAAKKLPKRKKPKEDTK